VDEAPSGRADRVRRTRFQGDATKSEDTILAGGQVITSGDGAWPRCATRPDILVRAAEPSSPVPR
jgi:hypothetical protein